MNGKFISISCKNADSPSLQYMNCPGRVNYVRAKTRTKQQVYGKGKCPICKETKVLFVN